MDPLGGATGREREMLNPEAKWAKARQDLVEADQAVTREARDLERARERLDAARNAEAEAWSGLEKHRAVTLENASAK